eukprot:gb/GECG01014296.1/.p1 GENE.gb/GECG01014296.1/~~gb/GECG01014296.1/.p1  ORF type:complete len:1092 (+),score=159.41 gb/GECG01014296.1/:1-3276(+)
MQIRSSNPLPGRPPADSSDSSDNGDGDDDGFNVDDIDFEPGHVERDRVPLAPHHESTSQDHGARAGDRKKKALLATFGTLVFIIFITMFIQGDERGSSSSGGSGSSNPQPVVPQPSRQAKAPEQQGTDDNYGGDDVSPQKHPGKQPGTFDDDDDDYYYYSGGKDDDNARPQNSRQPQRQDDDDKKKVDDDDKEGTDKGDNPQPEPSAPPETEEPEAKESTAPANGEGDETSKDHEDVIPRDNVDFDLTVQDVWTWSLFPTSGEETREYCRQVNSTIQGMMTAIREYKHLRWGVKGELDTLVGVISNATSMLNLLANVHPQTEVRQSCLECIQILQSQVSILSTDAVIMMRIYEEYTRGLAPMLGKREKAMENIQKSAQNGDIYGPPALNTWRDDSVRLWLATRFVYDVLDEAKTTGIDVDRLAERDVTAEQLLRCEKLYKHYRGDPQKTNCSSEIIQFFQKMEDYQRLSSKASELSNNFELAIAQSRGTLVIKAEDVDKTFTGLPSSFVENHRVSKLPKQSLQKEGSGLDQNDVVVSTDYPDVLPIMKFAMNRTLRTELYVKSNSAAYPENSERLIDLLITRRNIASALNFDNWASLAQKRTMAGSPGTVNKFLERLHHLASGIHKDKLLEQLRKLLRKDQGENADLQPYDLSYYMEKLRTELLNVSDSETRNYFNVDRTHAGLLAVASDVFGLAFEVVSESTSLNRVKQVLGEDRENIEKRIFYSDTPKRQIHKWHEDVEVLNVYAMEAPPQKHLFTAQTWGKDSRRATSSGLERLSLICSDSSGQQPGCWSKPGDLLARIYLDLFPRAGKFSHAAMFPLRSGRVRNGAPEFALVCNFPKQGAMEFSQVETMFHEFGHGVHFIFSGLNKRLYSFSGLSMANDFLEVPSQVLEHWLKEQKTLDLVSRHEETKQSISKETLSKLKEEEKMRQALSTETQIFYSMMSLKLHEADNGSLPISTTNHKESIQKLEQYVDVLRPKYSPFDRIKGTHPEASFGHLSGYSSNYYTYLWSDVIVEDIVSSIRSTKAGLWNRTTLYNYVDKVLSQGGEIDARDQLCLFLGRNYSTAPYEEKLKSSSESLLRHLSSSPQIT